MNALRTTWVRRGLAGLGVVFLAAQLVPYGWEHPDPPVVDDAPWPSAESAALARAACYDCHSNETEWPVYAYVAATSWLVRRDVETGRDELSFSTWAEDPDADDAAAAVADRSMPPRQFTWLHPDARLSAEERTMLVTALQAMDGGDGGGGRGRGRSGDGGGGSD